MRVVIYSNDHRPSHVHAIRGDDAASFWLHCPDGPPELRENIGFKGREIARLASVLGEHLSQLCADWERIHGDP